MSTINVQLVDIHGRFTSKEFTVDDTVTTLAGVQAEFDDILATWEGVSDLGLDNATVSFPLTGAAIAAKAGSNIDEAAKVRLGMATGVGDENYRIPGPAKTAGVFDYISNGVVNVAHAAVVAWFDLFSTGNLRIGVNSQRAVDTIKSGYLEKK